MAAFVEFPQEMLLGGSAVFSKQVALVVLMLSMIHGNQIINILEMLNLWAESK